MCLRACAQHKHLINYVLHGPRPTHEIVYMKHMHLAYAQYIKQIIILMCSGVLCPIYKIKIKATSHAMGLMPIIVRSNIHVLKSLSLNTNIKYSCSPELLTQQKHQILMFLRARAFIAQFLVSRILSAGFDSVT